MSSLTKPPNRIGELRDARHWSVRDLAEKSGVDHSTVSRMERGAQALDVPRMRKLAGAFGVKLSELLNDEDVEMRANEDGRLVLAELRDVPEVDVPILVRCARDVVRVARSIAAQKSSAALLGSPETVTALAEVWNDWNDNERERALELLRVSARHDRR